MANDLELEDSVEQLQAKATEHTVPGGIWALFGGLVAWGVYYFAAYVGWDQTGDLSGQSTSLGTNVTHTIAYTAIPTAVIVAMAVAMARRSRARKQK
jgi:heme/copper-type cytochrome/quinol oxidase subunit 2